MRSSLKRIALSVVAVGSITLFILVAVELGSFLVLKAKARANERRTDSRRALSVYHTSSWADRYWREFMGSERIDYHPYVIWRRHPFSGETITVDASGLRQTTNVQCSPASFTIWMFGGSTLWGSGSPDNATIPSLLAEEYARHGRPVCVRNYGEMAWVSTQEVIKLLLELKRAQQKPDLVVFYDGANEPLLPYQSDAIDGHQNLDRIRAVFDQSIAERDGSFAWLLKSNTAQLLNRSAAWLGLGRRDAALADRYRSNRASIEALTRVSVRSYFQNIETVHMLASGHGFGYAFFWQPVLYLDKKPLTSEEVGILESERRMLPGLDEVYRNSHALVAGERRRNFHDLADAFHDQRATLYIDALHVGPEGNRVIAKRVYDVLRRS